MAARSEVGRVRGRRLRRRAGAGSAGATLSVATRVEEAKACEHYDKVQAHMQGDLLESIQRSLAEQEESLRAPQASPRSSSSGRRPTPWTTSARRCSARSVTRSRTSSTKSSAWSRRRCAARLRTVSAELISDALAVEERAQTRARAAARGDGEITRSRTARSAWSGTFGAAR